MSNTLQIKRKIGGAVSAPTGANKEGDIAISFPGAAGDSTQPTLWANDGGGWREVNPKAGAINTQSITLGGAGADIGAAVIAWIALDPTNNKITGDIVIATWGTPSQAFVKTGADATLAASWTSLGGAVTFATAAELAAGTSTTAALNPAILAAAGLNKGGVSVPDATPANDAGKMVALDAAGKIPTGFLPVASTQYIGALDATVAPAGAALTAKAGDFITASKAGTIQAGWTGATGTIKIGDVLMSDGTKWHVIEHTVDLSAYLPLAGGTMAATGNVAFTASAALTARLDGGDATKSSIDNFTLDMGTF